MLPCNEPNRLFGRVRHIEVRDCYQMQVAALYGLSDYLDANARKSPHFLQEPFHSREWVRNNMRDPESILLGRKVQDRLLCLRIPLHRWEVLPLPIVVAEDR